METYSNTGYVEVFQVVLKWILNTDAQLIATTGKLLVAGTEMLFMNCFTLAFTKILLYVLVYNTFSLLLSLSSAKLINVTDFSSS